MIDEKLNERRIESTIRKTGVDRAILSKEGLLNLAYSELATFERLSVATSNELVNVLTNSIPREKVEALIQQCKDERGSHALFRDQRALMADGAIIVLEKLLEE